MLRGKFRRPAMMKFAIESKQCGGRSEPARACIVGDGMSSGWYTIFYGGS